MSINQKMAHGALWSFLEKGGQQGLSFVVFMVVARLVGPEEYGLASLCFIYFSIASMILNGLVDGIVSLQVEDDARLSSLFWMSLAVGVVMGLFCFITAKPLAAFMEQPRLADLIYSFSIVPLLVALAAVPNIIILKDMNFKAYAIRTLSATALGGVVGVVMAIKGFGAYAIVGQQTVLYVVTNLIIWPFAGWRPKAMFDWFGLKQVMKPGLGMLGLSALWFMNGQAPRFVIGHLLGPLILGFYALVIRLQSALVETLITPPLVVLYPALSKIKDNMDEQQLVAGRIVRLSGFVLFPLLAVASASAPIFVPLFFGQAWNEAVPLLQIYIIGLAVWPLSTIIQNLFRAHSKLSLYLRLYVIFSMLSLAAMLLLLLENGLLFMAYAVCTIPYIALPFYLIRLKRLVGVNLWNDTLNLWPSVLAAMMGFGVIYMFIQSQFLSHLPWIQLLGSLVLGGVTCSAVLLLLQYRQIVELIQFARRNFLIMNQGRADK